MKKRSLWMMCLAFIGLGLFSFAGPSVVGAAEEKRVVLSTMFPIHQITRNVAQGREGLDLQLMLPSHLGCPHDYALTPQDMQKLAKADILVVNGLGMEEFLGAPVKKANPKIIIIDSSSGIKEILEFSDGHDHGHHHGHDHGHDHSKEEHHGEKPYEWAGAFQLAPGLYRWSFAKVKGKYADPTMKMAYFESGPKDPVEKVEKKASEIFEKTGQVLKNGGRLRLGELHILHFDLERNATVFEVRIEKAGTYVFFTEHMPYEFESDEHSFKTAEGRDVKPIAEEPKAEHAHHHHGHHHHHSHDHHHHEGANPHLFASPRMTALLAMNIAAGLSKADPNGAAIYFKNAQAYSETMNKLADDMAALGKRLKNNRIVQPHGIFDYLARDMGLEIVAVLQPHGQEPSASEMIQLVKTIREKGVGAVFTEPQYPDKVGKSLGKETGVPVAMLDPVATGPENAPLDYYETVMRQNMKTLEATLGAK